MRAWLDELAPGDGPDTWAAVTHMGVIRMVIAAALRWDLGAPPPLRLLPERLHRVRRRGDGLLQLVGLNEPLGHESTAARAGPSDRASAGPATLAGPGP